MDILFWSGGKDAFLALVFHRQDNSGTPIKLLTTYDRETQRVPHQNIPVENIKAQARALDLEFILVPLPPDCPNKVYIEKINAALAQESEPVEALIFGDWHLRDIREWRETQFQVSGFKCQFPIWQKSIHDLLSTLLLQPAKIRISAVKDEFSEWIRIGELYNPSFVQQLPKHIDPMGEYGEFHTEVKFTSGSPQPRKQHLF